MRHALKSNRQCYFWVARHDRFVTRRPCTIGSMYIPANATALEFASALQEAGNISTVRVSVDILQPSPHGNDARRWRVTFTSFANGGDVPLLNVAELPDGTQARVNVTEVVKGQSAPVARIDLVRGSDKDVHGDLSHGERHPLNKSDAEQYKVEFQDAFTR